MNFLLMCRWCKATCSLNGLSCRHRRQFSLTCPTFVVEDLATFWYFFGYCSFCVVCLFLASRFDKSYLEVKYHLNFLVLFNEGMTNNWWTQMYFLGKTMPLVSGNARSIYWWCYRNSQHSPSECLSQRL